jgi:hypothetical protein
MNLADAVLATTLQTWDIEPSDPKRPDETCLSVSSVRPSIKYVVPHVLVLGPT